MLGASATSLRDLPRCCLPPASHHRGRLRALTIPEGTLKQTLGHFPVCALAVVRKDSDPVSGTGSARRVFGDGLVAAQQRVHLGLAEATVAPGSADAADSARRSPASDRLRIDPEECSDLSRGEQALARALHVFSPPLSRSRRGWTVYSVAGQDRFLPCFRKT